jgi:DNA-binding MurR/RpiR family transcriptional regulator
VGFGLVKDSSFEKINIRIALFIEKASGAKKKVAQFFLENIEDIAFITLDQIKQRIDISASTITRTASEIGFKGFPDFQNSVRECIKKNLMSPVERLKEVRSSNVHESFIDSLKKDRINLRQLEQLNSVEKFNEAISIFAKAKNVYLCGMQASCGSIYIFGNYLSQIRSGVHYINLMNMALSEQILEMKKEDVLLVFSLPRYNRFSIRIAKEALERGCSLVSVTDNSFGSLGLISTVAFSVPYESVGFFNSHVAACSLLQALLAGINLKIRSKALVRLDQYSKLLDKWELYKAMGDGEL